MKDAPFNSMNLKIDYTAATAITPVNSVEKPLLSINPRRWTVDGFF